MKKLLFTALLFLSAVAPAHAEDWDAKDKILLGTAVATTVIDWGQSRYIAKHHSFYEKNPILGRHPSMAAVNTYFAASLVAEVLIANALPSTYRKIFLGSVTVLEVSVIGKNKSIGIRTSF